MFGRLMWTFTIAILLGCISNTFAIFIKEPEGGWEEPAYTNPLTTTRATAATTTATTTRPPTTTSTTTTTTTTTSSSSTTENAADDENDYGTGTGSDDTENGGDIADDGSADEGYSEDWENDDKTVFGFTVRLESYNTGSWVDYFKSWGLTRFSNYDLCNGMRQVAEKASTFHELQLAFCRTPLTSVKEMDSFDELSLYFLTSSLRANRALCFSRLALELQNIFNIRPVGNIHSSKVRVQVANALVAKETMLQKHGKSRDADTVWEEDRSFQIALHNALPQSRKPIAIYSATLEELPSSTYVVVFENSLPPLENPFGTVGDYEVTGWWQSEGLTIKKGHPRMIAQVCDADGNVTMTIFQAETVSNTSEPTPISDMQRYATLLLDGTRHGGTNLDGRPPNAIDLGQIQQYPPNASVGYHIYYSGASVAGNLTTDLGVLVKTTVIASEINCTQMSHPHAVLRVGIRFILPDRNMPFRWNWRMEANATAYRHVLECATKYIEHMLNVIHSWDGILEATWMYRLETLNGASVIVHGHIELNVYRLIQKHYHLDWSSIVKTFNRNFMNKFPFRPVALFMREFGIKCNINGIEALRKPGIISGAIKKNQTLTLLLTLIAMWVNVNILE